MVELDLVRGYPLPFDPADPAVKKVGTYKVINGEEINRSPSSTSIGNPNTLPRNSQQDNKSNGYNSDGEGIRRDARLGGKLIFPSLYNFVCKNYLLFLFWCVNYRNRTEQKQQGTVELSLFNFFKFF